LVGLSGAGIVKTPNTENKKDFLFIL